MWWERNACSHVSNTLNNLKRCFFFLNGKIQQWCRKSLMHDLQQLVSKPKDLHSSAAYGATAQSYCTFSVCSLKDFQSSVVVRIEGIWNTDKKERDCEVSVNMNSG